MFLAITKHINITLKLNIYISITSPNIGRAVPGSVIMPQGAANLLFFFLSLILYGLSPVLRIK